MLETPKTPVVQSVAQHSILELGSKPGFGYVTLDTAVLRRMGVQKESAELSETTPSRSTLNDT